MSENKLRKVVTPKMIKAWIAGLADQKAKGAILDRIDRLKLGNFGDIDSIKSEPGLFEIRVDEGQGYRVYFGEFDDEVIILVLGGNKSTQIADMKKAGKILRWLKDKQAEEKAAKAQKTAAQSKTKPKRK